MEVSAVTWGHQAEPNPRNAPEFGQLELIIDRPERIEIILEFLAQLLFQLHSRLLVF